MFLRAYMTRGKRYNVNITTASVEVTERPERHVTDVSKTT